jgi:hypothetical protein
MPIGAVKGCHENRPLRTPFIGYKSAPIWHRQGRAPGNSKIVTSSPGIKVYDSSAEKPVEREANAARDGESHDHVIAVPVDYTGSKLARKRKRLRGRDHCGHGRRPGMTRHKGKFRTAPHPTTTHFFCCMDPMTRPIAGKRVASVPRAPLEAWRSFR